ncbi:MAG: copper homeostasis protein CutC [Dokdonella sp.]|uniref:copper homeostasis protein CutC n=1 Tax=Dokdonella sp. TaxID=2291710 RepID=UPI0032633271
MTRPLLEIAANSPASALMAQDAGADRIELCASLGEGGLTPTITTIAIARDRLRIPLYVLIRPRAGDFLYDDLELETMLGDIEHCVRLGCDGVVIGALDADGRVDMDRCRTLVAAAGCLGVTFHRAFDITSNPRQALEDIVALGCERVLTSGQQTSAVAGATLVGQLVDQAGSRIVVMPGAGIDSANIVRLRAKTGATEFHASAKRALASKMRHRPERLQDLQCGEVRSDGDEIRRLVEALRNVE